MKTAQSAFHRWVVDLVVLLVGLAIGAGVWGEWRPKEVSVASAMLTAITESIASSG